MMEMTSQMNSNNHSYDDEEVDYVSVNDVQQESIVESADSTDSSDELSNHHPNGLIEDQEDDIKEYDDEDPVNDQLDDDVEDEEEIEQEINQINSDTHSQFQQNCLAAAQMMQLMSSGSVQHSQSLSHLQHQQHQQHQQQSLQLQHHNGESSEKENIPICKFCNKVFANFSNLNHHVSAIHLNQSKWVCSQCGKICSSKSNLKVHLRVHLRVKPYHCRWCTYSCMHHSSIRDHLAKVHPDKTHTPLQPGYLFNSQAVPEPEVFNAKGFNVNTFVTDSKLKRSSREMDSQSHLQASPEHIKRMSKKSRLNEHKQQQQQQQQQEQHQQLSPSVSIQTNQSSSSSSNSNSNSFNNNNINTNITNSSSQSTPMSNLYNAYAMARMFPFMYNPMQYAAAAAVQQQQQPQLSPTALLNILNHSSQNHNTASQYTNQHSNQYSYPNTSSSSASADEHTSNLSYSNSSRSSSLSPSSNKNKLPSSISEDSAYKSEPAFTKRTNISSVRNIFSVDQMLSNTKVNKETQTDSSMFSQTIQTGCSYCSHCSNKTY